MQESVGLVPIIEPNLNVRLYKQIIIKHKGEHGDKNSYGMNVKNRKKNKYSMILRIFLIHNNIHILCISA